MSRLLAAQRAFLAPAWARNSLYRLAGSVPSLDQPFAEDRSLVDRISGRQLITITRSSAGTYVDSGRVLRTAAVDEPRFDHDPVTGESLGLLVEEQRTNSIRNNTMVGAVAGTPGTLPTNWAIFTLLTGLTREIVGTGIEDGINYVDFRLRGTPSAAGNYAIYFETQTAATAATAQVWTFSRYVKLAGGTTSGVNGIRSILIENTAAGAYVTQGNEGLSIPASTSLNLNRSAFTRTLSGGATVGALQPSIELVLSGAAIDFTLRIGLPQLEQGSFATSAIPTSGTAATRNADIASITGTNLSSWYRQNEGTLFIDCIIAVPASGSNQFLFRASDNGYNNSVALNIQVGGFGSMATSAGGVFDGVAASPLALTANAISRLAGAYAVNNLAVALNNGTINSDTSATMPTALTRADIGSDHLGGNRIKAGHIRRLTYWPTRLPNSTLQRLTQ